jgi:hypothetical protein
MEKQPQTYARALKRLQDDYPTQWHLIVSKATQNIKAAMRNHKLDLTQQGVRDAVSYCLTMYDDAATVLTYFAAAGIMLKLNELQQEHIAIELREITIEDQLLKLNDVDWSPKDKIEVGSYYHRRMAAVKCRITEIINEVTALGKSLGVAPPEPALAEWVPQPRRPFGQWGNRGGAVSA